MNFSRRLRYLFRRQATEAEMAEEMRYHLEQRAADFAAEGMPNGEALDAARRKFGNLASIQEQARENWGWGWLERFGKDLAFAARHLVKSPGLTLLAIVTLGLGLGVNTAMFSILESYTITPLPYPDSGRLDAIYRATPQHPDGSIAPADFLELQRHQEGYGEVAAGAVARASFSEPGQPAEPVSGYRVTRNFFAVLQVQPQLGRDFRPGEDLPGNDHILLISDRCWKKRFGGDAGIIGRTVRVDGEPHLIVGVLPAFFDDWRHLGWVDTFRPLALTKEQAADHRSQSLELIGRRAPGLSRSQTDGFIGNFGTRLAKEFPEINAGSSWRVVPLNDTFIDPSGRVIIAMLVLLSGFVLLIACSNLANLLLAQTMARAREFAVRAALGASRRQLLRPLITESLALALAGGTCAVLVALAVLRVLNTRSISPDGGVGTSMGLDWGALGWMLVMSLVTVLAFGLAPALFAMRIDLNDTLKSGARGAVGGRGTQRFRQALIVGQFTLTMVLLAGAGLMIGGLHELNIRRAGWVSSRLITGAIQLPAARYSDPEKITAFQHRALERLERLPGVAAASLSAESPIFNWAVIRKFAVEGSPPPVPGHEPAAVCNAVSPHYFDTFGTRLFAGRAFDARDVLSSPKVYVINQAMARGLFGNASPIGRRLAEIGGENLPWGEIVGVVNDVQSVATDPSPAAFQLYQPFSQAPTSTCVIAVRSSDADPLSLVPTIRATVMELDPDMPVRKLHPADIAIRNANYQMAVLRDLLSGMAVLALSLAVLGIYGIIARTMAQRSSEFAIRLALGASVKDITALVLAAGVRLALLGAVLGLFGAYGFSQVLAAGMGNMHFNSPPVLAATTLLLIAVALVTCWLPARRAGQIDAMQALRAE